MIGSVASLQGNAEKLSVVQLQQAMRDGTLPAYIGMPILQQKVQEQKQAQAATQSQQPITPVAQQIEQQAQSLNSQTMPMTQASRGIEALPSNLPEEYAHGGIIAFAGEDGSYVDPLLNDPYRQLIENRSDAGRIDASGMGSLANDIQQKGLVEGAYPAGIAKLQEGKNAVVNAANNVGTAVGDIGGQIGNAAGYATTAVLHGKEGLNKREAEKQKILEANAIAAKKHGVPVNILNGITATESNFNPNAKNANSSATGAHQITAGTWKDYGTSNPNDRYNPLYSADVAGDILRRGIMKYPNDLQKATATYHLGLNAPESKLAADTTYTNQVLGQTGQTQPQAGIQTPYAMPEEPQQDYALPNFSALKTPVKSSEEYQQQMQQSLGTNEGIAGIKSRLAEMEKEGASEKEKAPWMALMQAGLGMMAGTSPFAGVNIGQGGIAGLKAYAEAQDKVSKGEEKRLAIADQLANAQRAEQMAAWKYGADSHKADVAENKAIDLAEKKAQVDMQQNKNKNQLDLYKEKVDIPLKQAQAAAYGARAAGIGGTSGNPSDYEGARNIAMANPTAPQYAEFFTPDPSGKPVWNELKFQEAYNKATHKNPLDSMSGEALTQLANGMDEELAQAAKRALLSKFAPNTPQVSGVVRKFNPVTGTLE